MNLIIFNFRLNACNSHSLNQIWRDFGKQCELVVANGSITDCVSKNDFKQFFFYKVKRKIQCKSYMGGVFRRMSRFCTKIFKKILNLICYYFLSERRVVFVYGDIFISFHILSNLWYFIFEVI